MTRIATLLLLLSCLTACDSAKTNPFITNNESSSSTGTGANGTTVAGTNDSGTEIASSVATLPGTAAPVASDVIFRREARSESETGNGFAEGFSYNAANDTFTVDNIAFDGAGPYTAVRTPAGARLGIGPFSVFQNQAQAVDGLTTSNIDQLTYRALYGKSSDGSAEIAIVRSAAYIDYGFGGFIYQRNGGVKLPSSGQAVYKGTNNYGGLRDFDGRSGLEYVRGDLEARIDFDDFNGGAGVIGIISNRKIFDLNQKDITADVLAAFGNGVTALPTLRFKIQPGVIDANGELAGEVESTNPVDGKIFESGKYYAVLSGPNAKTIAGVVVATGEDPRNSNITFRETGGFFAYRQ